MRLNSAKGRLRSGRRFTLALVALGIVTGAVYAREPQVHKLTGIVVSKGDGKPVANATVAMADSERAYIYVGNRARISAWGPADKWLFLFTKRNGKTACEATTDEQGRFTLRDFQSMSGKYTIVAGARDAGLTIIDSVCPRDYAETPLRIEIGEPTYLTVPKGPALPDQDLSTYISVGLEMKAAEAQAESEEQSDALGRNVFVNMHSKATGEQAGQRVGPLIGGREYRVARLVASKRLPWQPKLFETVVKAEAGRTTAVEIAHEGGTTISGRLTTKEGKPLRDVNVLMKVTPDAKLVLGALTDQRGGYTIPHAPPGTHELELVRYTVRVGPG